MRLLVNGTTSLATTSVGKISVAFEHTTRSGLTHPCSYLHAARSVWGGLPTFLLLGDKDVVNPCLNEDIEVPALLVTPLDVKAGFVLTNPQDPQYKRAIAHRSRFGQIVHRASNVLRQESEGEDHIDAVIALSRAIDVYLLEYAMTRSSFESLTKSHRQARE